MKILDVPQSGSVGGVTSSRNRYGQYRRSRATPVNPNSSAQGTVRARLAANSAAWRAITELQRQGWRDLAQSMNRTDSLGQVNPMTGFAAFCSVNQNLLEAGSATVDDAPVLSTPDALTSATVTTTGGTLSVAYTVTPLATGAKLQVYASPQRSAGRNYNSDYRLIFTSAAAAASPANILSAYTAKFGAPVVGNKIFLRLRVSIDGFLSGPLDTSVVVAA